MTPSRTRNTGRSRLLPTPLASVALAAGAVVLPFGALTGPVVAALDAAWLLGVLALVVADARALPGPRQISVTRDVPPAVSLQGRAAICVHVRNAADTAVRIVVKDSPPEELVAAHRLVRLSVAARSQGSGEYPVQPGRRGVFAYKGLDVRIRGRLGLATRQWTQPANAEVRVLPNVTPAREHEILARQARVTQMGLRASVTRGKGLEFASLRDWTPDDGLRRVDWKATARRGKLIAREYEFERNQNIILALDLGRPMASQVTEAAGAFPITKADHAVNACVLLGWVAAHAGDRVGLLAFSDDVRAVLGAQRGIPGFRRLLDTLTPLQPDLQEPDYSGAFLRLAATARRRSLVVVLTDCADPVSSERLLRGLWHLQNRHLVLVCAISDYELRDRLTEPPRNTLDVYQQTVAASMLSDRRHALQRLESMGVLTLDASPQDLTVATVNRYLEIKQTGLL